MTLAMVFPGQGSQSVGMHSELAERFYSVRDTYAEASDLLGYDLWSVVSSGPAETLDSTAVTQPAMLTAGVATWRVWNSLGGAKPALMAGHSLGEYTALVCAGVLSFSDAVPLVRQRGELMQNAVAADACAMAAILGLDDNDVLEVCRNASDVGVVEAVNFNSPGQVVITGDRVAVENAVELAKSAGARRAILLSVSVPSHSSLMVGAGEALSAALKDTAISESSFTVLSSVAVRPYRDADDVRSLLTQQVSNPVQWVRTTHALVEAGADRIVEAGPGKVLAGLVKRIDRSIDTAVLDTPDAIEKALAD